MLTLKLSHDKNGPHRMSTVLSICARALSRQAYTVSYSEDMHSLFIKESDLPFLPSADPHQQLRIAYKAAMKALRQLSVPAYNAIKARHDYEEDQKAESLEDQGGKDAS